MVEHERPQRRHRTDLPVPILVYHEISPESHPSYRKYVVPPAAFARHMRFLQAARYHPISLDRLLSARTCGLPLPPRPIVITLDDGFRDCVRYAAEVLLRHRYPATFFAVAGLAGETSRWVGHLWSRELPLADWGMLRALREAGFTCGAHTLTHPKLVALADAVCREELRGARRLMEDRLGCAIVHSAYPFGAFDARVRDLVAEAGYHTACTMEIGLSTAQDHPLALRRVPVTGHDTLVDFACRVRTGYSWRELRHAARGRVARRVRRFAASAARTSGRESGRPPA